MVVLSALADKHTLENARSVIEVGSAKAVAMKIDDAANYTRLTISEAASRLS